MHIHRELDDADVLGIRSLIAAHPDFDPSFSEILNFSGVTTAKLSTAASEIVSRRASAFGRNSIHIVVAPQDFIFGLGRMTQVFNRREYQAEHSGGEDDARGARSIGYARYPPDLMVGQGAVSPC